MNAIAIFNNKGGVGKTTLLCNIASYFQKVKGKRVVVIDADPQCNASIYLMGEDEVIRQLSSSAPKTIYKILNTLKKGKGYIDLEDVPISHSSGFEIDVICGDTRMSIIEDFLSEEYIKSTNGDPRGMMTTFSLKELLQRLNSQYDFVFIDAGPSLGALNRIVLFACDYFIMPMSSDIFSIKAIDNIANTLGEWIEDIEDGLKKHERKEGEPFQITSHNIVPSIAFLGYVHQQYTAKTQSGEKRPVRAYDRIIRKMPDRINEKFAHFYPAEFATSKLKLGDIPNFNSLIPLSQLANVPIFDLGGRDGVVGAHFAKVREYRDVMNQIADNILSNIQEYDKMAR